MNLLICIEILTQHNTEYISLTSIAKYKDEKKSDDIIKNWIRNRSTIEYLGLWGKINNPNSKPVEFDGFKSQYIPFYISKIYNSVIT